VIEKQTNHATYETTKDNTKATHVANKDTIEKGIVEYCAIPDKPKSKNQKYVATKK
jgi:hypothetical protein